MTRHIVNPQNIHSFCNQFVQTPLGEGRSFGLFQLKDAKQEGIGERVLVRLPVNDMTRPHLKASNCLTPNANHSALFTFDMEEVRS